MLPRRVALDMLEPGGGDDVAAWSQRGLGLGQGQEAS